MDFPVIVKQRGLSSGFPILILSDKMTPGQVQTAEREKLEERVFKILRVHIYKRKRHLQEIMLI